MLPLPPTTLAAFVRDNPSLLEDQEQAAQVVDVVEGIGLDDNQIRQLANFHGAKVGRDAAQGSGMPGGCQEGLPGGGAVLDPQAHFEQGGLFERPNI